MKHNNPVYDENQETQSILFNTSGQDEDESNEKTGLLKGDGINESTRTESGSW